MAHHTIAACRRRTLLFALLFSLAHSFTPIQRRSSTIQLYSSSSSTSAATTNTVNLQAPPALSIQDLSCSHDGGTTWQLQDVSYVLPRTAKVALVGRNGTGKSTLLRILAENTSTSNAALQQESIKYTGKITVPRDVQIAYVEQEPDVSDKLTVADALLGITEYDLLNIHTDNSNDVFQKVKKYYITSQTAETNPQVFAKASAVMDQQCWDVLTRSEEVASKLRVQHLKESKLSNLSGGERKRVSLAAALAQDPDVLLLDEPTNFLSLAGVQWLADALTSTSKKLTILMVTHDRAFLDDICDFVLELDNGKLYEYTGKYQDYLEAKADRLSAQDAAVQAAKAKYRVELEWMRRQPQARQTKAKARIEAFYKLEKATKPRPRDPNLQIADEKRRIGNKVVSMRHVNLQFGDRTMLSDFSYDFCKGDKICLAGANGVGKTTFVRVLTGELPPDSGEIEVGDTVVMGVFDQTGLDIETDDSQTVLSFVMDEVQASDGTALSEAPDMARTLLRTFEFPPSRWNERIVMLSGGEKRRLQMLSVFSKRPNVLVLDEPSVDCDLDTLTALESYLQKFEGVLIIVSHDRMFADKVADHLFVFEGDGEIKDFQGTLSEYAQALIELETKAISGNSATNSDVEKKVDYKEDREKRNEERNKVRRAKKDMVNLETAMEKLRTKVTALQKEIDASSDKGWSVLADLTSQLEAANSQIDEKEMTWMELAELVEGSDVDL